MLARIMIISLVAAVTLVAVTPEAAALRCGQTIFPPSETIRVCSAEVADLAADVEKEANVVVDFVQCVAFGHCD